MNHYPHQKDCLGLMLTAVRPTCILVFYGATQNIYGLRPAKMRFSGLYPSIAAAHDTKDPQLVNHSVPYLLYSN